MILRYNMSNLFSRLEGLIRSGHEGNSAASVLARLGTPCASMAIMEDGVISSHCFTTGQDDTETIFQACSISKPVFAVALMRLVDEGKLSLDGRIGNLLPRDVVGMLTRGATPAQASAIKSITISQLLSHTSGLSQGGFPGYSVLDDARIPTAREVLAGAYPVNTKDVHLQGFPGQSQSYSGGGFTVLQLIFEAITEKDLPSAMRDLVLQPLGMTRSFYNQLPPEEENWAKAHYTGYTPCEDAQRVNPEQAPASLWTTPSDLMKLVRAVQKSLQSSDNSGFLRQETAKTMLTVVDLDMAHSWFVPGDSRAVFSHAGSNVPGFRTYVAGYANLPGGSNGVEVPKNCGISIMTNSAEGDFVIWKLLQAVPFLNKWPEIPLPRGYPAIVPLAAPEEEVDGRWKRWLGSWTCGKKSWSIEAGEADADRPSIRYDGLLPFPLAVAAMAEAKDDDDAMNLVVDGLEVLVRLRGDDTIEVVNGCSSTITRLARA